jgi:hypothetical protein
MHSLDDTGDYVWHFKLPETAHEADEDALAGMVREQIEALLRCVTFTSHGVSVRVTGFHFLDQPELDHPVGLSLPYANESEPDAPGDEAKRLAPKGCDRD